MRLKESKREREIESVVGVFSCLVYHCVMLACCLFVLENTCWMLFSFEFQNKKKKTLKQNIQ